MSEEPSKDLLLSDYRARQVAAVLAIRGQILNSVDDPTESYEQATIVDADGCNIDARVTHALQLDFSPVQIEIRLGIPRDAAAALLRKTADWIEQDGDRLMNLNLGQSARRIPPASDLLQELDEGFDGEFDEEITGVEDIPPA